MVDEVFGLAIRPEHDGIVARAQYFSRDRAQDRRALAVPLIDVWAHRLRRDPVADAVGVGLPVASAIEAIVIAFVMPDERPFDGVPGGPDLAIERPIALINVPVGGCAEDDLRRTGTGLHI